MIAVTKYKTYDFVHSSHVTTTNENSKCFVIRFGPKIICIDRMATYLRRQPDCTYTAWLYNSGYCRLGRHVEETMQR